MSDSLSSRERRALLRTLKTLPSPVFEEIRVVLDVPPDILPVGTMGDRAVALIDWAKSDIGCGLLGLKEEVGAIVTEYQSQEDRQDSVGSGHIVIRDNQLRDNQLRDNQLREDQFREDQFREDQRVDTVSDDNDEQGEAHLVIAVFWQEPSRQKIRIQPKLCYRDANTRAINETSLMKEDCAVVLGQFPKLLNKLVSFVVPQVEQCFAGYYETWTLAIALFVPIDLLSRPLSAWIDQENELLKLHPLVLGCSDRFDPDQASRAVELRNQMKRGWQRFQEHVPDGSTTTLEALAWLDSGRASQENFESYSGFQCFGTWLKPDAKHLERWKELIWSGIPLALWLCDAQPGRNQIEQVFGRLIQGSRFDLLREIPRIRDEQQKNGKGRVGVFYENPAYVPDVPSVTVEDQFFVWPDA